MKVLEQKGILVGIDNETRGKLLKISGRTIDRLLKGEKEKLNVKGREGTKPGSLLKNQIPVKIFSEWDDKRPLTQYPFQILGIDSDNGSEFINHHLIKFCEENKITFTRARPYFPFNIIKE